MLIKERIGKVSKRGLYIQDRELIDSLFKPGTHFSYHIDMKSKVITIVPEEDITSNTVSKRMMKDTVKPVVDLRSKEVLKLFETVSELKISIYDDKILVYGVSTDEKVFVYETDFDELNVDKSSVKEVLHLPIKVLSLFSGAGVFDYSFMQEDFEIVKAIEIDHHACMTYRHNIGNHVLNEDINNVDFKTLEPCDVIIGGSPCQDFSLSNQRTRFLDSPKNKLVLRFIEAVEQVKAKVFVLENVPGVLSAGGGMYLKEIQERLSNYRIRYGVLNSKDFNSAQSRRRAIIIGSYENLDVQLPVGDSNSARTVGEAFSGLHDGIPNQLDYSIPKELTKLRMAFVPMGSNFESIPDKLKPSGNHSNIFKRLHWDQIAPSLPNIRKSNITHPFFHRILSVRETARLFDLDDSFVFKGPLSSLQQQICNSVPINLGRAIAREIKKAFRKIQYI